MVKELGRAVVRLVLSIVLYILVSAGVQFLFTSVLVGFIPQVLIYLWLLGLVILLSQLPLRVFTGL